MFEKNGFQEANRFSLSKKKREILTACSHEKRDLCGREFWIVSQTRTHVHPITCPELLILVSSATQIQRAKEGTMRVLTTDVHTLVAKNAHETFPLTLIHKVGQILDFVLQ